MIASLVRPSACSVGDHAAVAHDHDAVGTPQHLAEHVRDEDAGDAVQPRLAHEGEQLLGGVLVETRRGSSRITTLTGLSTRKSARDLDHLLLRQGEIADESVPDSA